MKKLCLITFLLINSLCSICFAEFQKPNEERWFTIFESDKLGYWLDKETIKYKRESKNYSNCYNHRLVECWILIHDGDDKKHSSAKSYMQLDLDCRTTKTNHIILYDKNNKKVDSKDVSFLPPQPVVPESFGEYLVKEFDKIWEENYNK